MTIRPARADDLDAVAAIHVRVWHETYAGQLPASVIAGHTVEKRRAQWASWIDAAEQRLFVAEAGDRVVGLAAVRPGQAVADFADGELLAVYLLPEAQGQGLGRALVAASADHARISGTTALGFWVLATNLPAQRFYERLGAVRMGESSEDHGCSRILDFGYRLTL